MKGVQRSERPVQPWPKCRWCGKALDERHAADKYCSPEHRGRAYLAQFVSNHEIDMGNLASSQSEVSSEDF